ncbi:MAG: acyl-CoA dehydrogenase family protein [Chloroflexi bacterium]|nr:acyl-CoA dehydrogenase family protein [Chloroflexota bacterium]
MTDALLRRAAELVPVLKERAVQTERLRRLPRETVDDLVASELMRLGVPERFGGLGPDYDRAYPIAAELARGCAAAAWCYSLWTVHAWMVGHMPERAQTEFFANGPDVLCSSSFATTSTVKSEPCDSGLRLSGRWEFSSGSDHADWLLLGTGAAGALALVPRPDFEVLDTWHASGLCGSGSHDVVVNNAFVPGHRLLDIDLAGASDLTGWELHHRLTYRVPLRVMLAWDLVAPLLGVAQAALDEFVHRIQAGKTGAYMARSEVIQLRIAEASAGVEAARALMHHRIAWVLAKASRGDAFSELERATVARDRAFVVRLCMQAVNGLFDVSGGHALFLSDPLQRAHRDAQAIAHRAGLTLEFVGTNYGRLALASPSSDQ